VAGVDSSAGFCSLLQDMKMAKPAIITPAANRAFGFIVLN
jgi:hypothetical protein